MTKSLVVVESPAKARTIAGFLGAGYEVLASIGHIRDLPRNEKEVPEDKRATHGRLGGIAPDDDFDVVYVVPPSKREVIKQLKAALKRADELILATDEDREGEAISWHIVDVLQPKVPVKRMVFHEITPSAIDHALQNPRNLYMKLVEAQEGRRILDRLVGYETSPVLWRKIGQSARSAGRVQSVAVRMVVERERARMAFHKAGWWDLEGQFADAKSTAGAAGDQPFRASMIELDGKRLAEGRDFDAATGGLIAGKDVVVLDEARARGLVDRLTGRPFRVASVESKSFTEKPKAPFTTSTLQQEAARKLRYPAAKTMAVAQRLYERGFITYMRTDSTNLSDQAIGAARTAIEQLYGASYLPPAPRLYKGKVKNAQEAHEAIRPAGERIRSPDEVRAELDADEQRLYELVWIRTIACQMVDARGRNTTVRLTASSSGGENVVFRASGRTYDFLGYRRAYVESVDDDESDADAVLPPLVEGQDIASRTLAAAGHETKPPARFTEASLVKEMEERGIGRPSTYATVLGTIQSREYVWKKGTALVPSWTAFAVTKLLEDHFGQLVDYGFTASMEEELDRVARDGGKVESWLHSFYFGNGHPGLRKLVADEHLAKIDPRAVSTIPIGVDAEGVSIVVRVGRYGPYVQRGDGDERGAIPPEIAPDELTIEKALELIRRQAEGPRALGADPASGLPVFVLDGRFGPYVQLGEQEPKSKKKPKRASLFKSMTPQTVDLQQALMLLSLPRTVGADSEGRTILARPGRFGPYLERSDGDTRSMDAEEMLLTITVPEAEALFLQPKRGRGRVAKPPLLELGESPDTNKPIRVLDGRFGPYVTDGDTNATLPRGSDPTTLTVEEALALLRARAEAAPSTKKKGKAKAKTTKAKSTAKAKTGKAAKAVEADGADEADDDGSTDGEVAAKPKKAPAKKAAAKKKAPAKKAAAKSKAASAEVEPEPEKTPDAPKPRRGKAAAAG
ncbi:MAG: type I DNA topoisomerase [Myxococcota bacterium]